MFKPTFFAAGLVLAWGMPAGAQANAEIDSLRAEIRQIRVLYESRLADLEVRLQQTQPAAAPASAANSFNPEASLILQGSYTHQQQLADRHISGFMSAGHNHGGGNGFNLDHTELVFSAHVDPLWHGHANFALADGELEVEEAWFQSLGLDHGLSLKGGRFYSGLGYLNGQHSHAWDFASTPLMYQALFGERFNNDGLQMKWLAPTETFLEFGVEAGRGGGFPSAAGGDNGVGAWSAFFHIGDDVNESHSWRAGLSYLRAKSSGRGSLLEANAADDSDQDTLFSGRSNTWMAEFVWKWAPDGNSRARNFKFQTEYFRRDEQGTLTCSDGGDGICPGDITATHASRQSGLYAQAVYQFIPHWRVGARWERLDSGKVNYGPALSGVFAPVDYRPERWSLMTDWSPSEFARLRLQYSQDQSMQGITDRQWTLQYVMSLGAHGAHRF